MQIAGWTEIPKCTLSATMAETPGLWSMAALRELKNAIATALGELPKSTCYRCNRDKQVLNEK